MIRKNIKYFCKDFIQIENYNEAVSDEQVWDCHHRKETDENKTREQLKQEGLYWNRPPQELIFLTHKEHTKIHQIGERNNNYGKHFSEEHKRNMSKALIGKKRKPVSDETRRKISEAIKKHFENLHK